MPRSFLDIGQVGFSRVACRRIDAVATGRNKVLRDPRWLCAVARRDRFWSLELDLAAQTRAVLQDDVLAVDFQQPFSVEPRENTGQGLRLDGQT